MFAKFPLLHNFSLITLISFNGWDGRPLLCALVLPSIFRMKTFHRDFGNGNVVDLYSRDRAYPVSTPEGLTNSSVSPSGISIQNLQIEHNLLLLNSYLPYIRNIIRISFYAVYCHVMK
jgi:hypothetical protein